MEDSGELITVAYTLGIAHPSGYPTWTLLAHLFTYIPFGSIAWRVNLMSAVFASLAVMLLFFICLKLTGSRVAAGTAALMFAFSATFWSQAVIAEVYTLHIFFFALNLLILLHWKEKQDVGDLKHIKWLYLFSFTYGLSLTNHLLSLLLAPAFLVYIFIKSFENLKLKMNIELFKPKFIAKMFFFFILGLIPLIYLPLRSRMNPAIDYGNPETLRQLFWVISGKGFSPHIAFSFKQLILGMIHFFNSVRLNFTVLFIIITLIGIIFLFKKKKLEFTLFAFALVTSSIVFLYKIDDIVLYYIPAFLILSIYLSFGLIFMMNMKIGIKKNMTIALTLLIMICLIVPQTMGYQYIDKSNYYYTYNYGKNILQVLPKDSILIVRQIAPNFILKYFQLVENYRTDVIVIHAKTFPADWYRKQIKRENPDLQVDLKLKINELALGNFIINNLKNKEIYLLPDMLFQEKGLMNQTLGKKFNNYEFLSEGFLYRVKIKNSLLKLNYNLTRNLFLEIKNLSELDMITAVTFSQYSKAQLDLARYLIKENEKDKAKVILDRFVKLYPQDQEIKNLLEMVKNER